MDDILAEQVFHVPDPTGELEFLLKEFKVVTRKIYDRFKSIKEIIDKNVGEFDMIKGDAIILYPGKYRLYEEKDRCYSSGGWLNGLELPTLEVLDTRENFCSFLWSNVIESPNNVNLEIEDMRSSVSATLTTIIVNDVYFDLFIKHWN